jgi:hypothetical protein
MDIAYAIAVSRGFTVPRANVIMSASHTHSGPGAVSPEFLWGTTTPPREGALRGMQADSSHSPLLSLSLFPPPAVAPATDLMVPSLQWKLSNSIADALVSAQASLQPATIGLSHTNLTGSSSLNLPSHCATN